jgi:acetyltransferase
VLAAAGFGLPAQVIVTDARQAGEAAARIGFPVAMKTVGPLHKSDAGGVRLGVRDPEEAQTAYADLSGLPGSTGVLVQEMVGGPEVILGAAAQPGYGHLIAFGLGGIHTEVLREVGFTLAPAAYAESLALIRGSRVLPVLEGARGRPAMSVDRLAELLTRLSLLVHLFPQVQEVDLNPVMGTGDRLRVVDARIIVT